ncbi:hypothetical protein F4782DRAFT_47912 [Xylaria castorea]|nr:hypothetical protein F4782DRAFT_47912 [Xylaria castorea]
MRHHNLLLALLASCPICTTRTNTAAEIQGQEASPSSTIITTTVEADDRFTTTTLPARHSAGATQIPVAAAPIAKRFQARQNMVAATASGDITSIATLPPTPTPTPTATSISISTGGVSSGGDGDNNETSDTNGEEEEEEEEAPSSTVTITITSNRTTTIRPTVTVTSLFSSIGSTTSGASGRLDPYLPVNVFIRSLFLIFFVGAVWG